MNYVQTDNKGNVILTLNKQQAEAIEYALLKTVVYRWDRWADLIGKPIGQFTVEDYSNVNTLDTWNGEFDFLNTIHSELMSEGLK